MCYLKSTGGISMSFLSTSSRRSCYATPLMPVTFGGVQRIGHDLASSRSGTRQHQHAEGGPYCLCVAVSAVDGSMLLQSKRVHQGPGRCDDRVVIANRRDDAQ